MGITRFVLKRPVTVFMAVLCLLVFEPEGFLIPAMCLITLLLTLFRSTITAGRKVSE